MRLRRVGEWMRGDGDATRLPMRMFWVALVLRVLVMTVGHTYRMRVINEHFDFGWEMGRIARALATGYGYADPFNGHSGPTAWTPPLYPLLLAGVFKVFGVYTLKSAWMILAVNSVFSAATAPAVYEIAWRCFGREAKGLKVALWSGWLWVLYPAAMQYAVHWVWDMALTAMLFSWAVVLALRVRDVGSAEGQDTAKTQTAERWAAFGLVWGLIALSNSSLVLFLPACGVWMLWGVLRRGGWGGPLRNAVLAGVCFVAVITPWTVRNYKVFHAFVPMRTNFGAELFQSVDFLYQGFAWGPTLPIAEAAPEFRRYERMGELAYSKEQGRRAMVKIKAHPGLFLRLAVKRADFYWFGVPHPVDRGVMGEVIRELNYSFLTVGGLLGLALALRRQIPGAWLFFWAFLLMPLLYYFVTVQARFRHPLEPLITVLIVYLFQSAEPRRARAGRVVAESVVTA